MGYVLILYKMLFVESIHFVGMHTFSFIDSNHWNTKYSLFYGWKVIQGLLSFRITFYLVTLDE